MGSAALVAAPRRTLAWMPRLPGREAADPEAWRRAGFSEDETEAIASCVRWTTTFPIQKVRKRNRVEAICPMVAPSIADGSFFFTAFPLREREPELATLDELLEEAADRFETEIEASDPRLRCLVLVLPGVRGARLLEATDPARDIKDRLMRRGLLVGEFFPGCPFATTFNRKLFALRSPTPMYVLRTFIEGDWRFICQVPRWRETYREQFGEPPASLRHLGGFWWKMGQRLLWRWDVITGALKNRGKNTPPRG